MQKLRLSLIRIAHLFALVSLWGSVVHVQTPRFTPNRLAVLQLGDGGPARGAVPSDIWASRQNPYFIDQFDPTGVNQSTPTIQVAIPTTGPTSLWVNGNAGTEGNMTRSGDRSILAFGGYCGDICSIFPTALPTPPLAPSNLSYDRGIGTVDAFGNYVNVYRGPSWYGIAQGKTNPRGVATDGLGNFWGCGNGYGSLYFNANTGDSPIQVQNLVLTSCSKIINNTLYNSVKSGESGGLAPGIYSHVRFNLTPFPYPNSASFPHLEIPADVQYQNCIGFDINPDGTVAYVADNKAGIQKYIKIGQAWKLAYNLSIPGYNAWNTGIRADPSNTSNLVGAFSVVVDWSQSIPAIFATTGDSAGFDPRDAKKGSLVYYGNRVIRIDDTNTVTTGENIIATSSILTTVVQAPVPNLALGSNYIVYKSVTFTPDLRPVVTSPPLSQAVVVGDTVQFSLGVSSKYPVTYQWFRGADLLPGESKPTLTLPSVGLSANNTIYKCLISTIYGFVTSPSATLTVTALPVLPSVVTVQNLTNYVGNNFTITAKLAGSDPKSGFQWSKDGVALSDADKYSGTHTATLGIVNAQTSDAGVYSVAASNVAGSSTSVVANLKVFLAAPVFVQPPSALTTFIGRSPSFVASVSGFQVRAKWYTSTKTTLAGTVLTPVGIADRISQSDTTDQPPTSTLTLSSAVASDATNYVAVFSNSTGSVTSAPVSLRLVVQPDSHTFASYGTVGQVYTQTFDSLPIPGGGSFEAANPQNMTYVVTNIAGIATNIVFAATNASVEIDYSLDNPADFGYPVISAGGIGGFGLSNTMSGWYGWSARPLLFAATSGDQSAAGLIDNGLNYNNINGLTSATTNRALGLLTSSKSGTVAFGVGIINKTGSTLNRINLGFTGELWRNNPIQQQLAVGLLIDPNGGNALFPTNEISNGALTYVDALKVAFPTSTDTQVNDGTQPANQVSSAVSGFAIPDWAPGSTLWLVWQSSTSAGGAQNVAVDNVRFSAATSLSQSIQFAEIPSQIVGAPPLTLNATASSGLPVSYVLVSGPATLVGNQLTLSGTGTVVVTAQQAGGGAYLPADPVTRTFVVQKASQSIAFAPLADVEFNPAVVITLNASASSGLPVAYTVVSGPGSVSGNSLKLSGSGSIVLTASQAGDGQYLPAADVAQTLVVQPGRQSIEFAPLGSIEFKGTTVIALNATAGSGLPITFTLVSGPGSVAGNTLTVNGPGSILVTASQVGNGAYLPASDVTRTLVVNGPSQTITFNGPGDQTYAPGKTVVLSATSSSGLAVTLTVDGGPGTLTGSQLTLTGAGTIRVTASQAGISSFGPATPVSRSIVVNKASQTLQFAAVGTQVLGGGPLTLVATASSGLPVTFSVLDGLAVQNDAQLFLTDVGTLIVDAEQAGNANYLAAEPSVQHFDVIPGLSVQVPARGSGGSTSLRLVLNAGSSVVLEETSDFLTWINLGSFAGKGVDSPVTIPITTTAASSGTRYWRVRIQP